MKNTDPSQNTNPSQTKIHAHALICNSTEQVIKTTKQAVGAKHSITYSSAIKMVLSASGYTGLFFRGLPIRIIQNGVNSVIFTVCWRGLVDWFGRRRERQVAEKERRRREK